jgi:hypothetical protein
VVRLAWNMPGSKGAERGEGYIQRQVVESARRAVARKAPRAKPKLLLDRYAPAGLPPSTISELGCYLMDRFTEAKSLPRALDALLRVFAESLEEDKHQAERGLDVTVFPWPQVIETTWEAIRQSLGQAAGLSREDVWRLAWEARDNLAAGVPGKGWWYYWREFTLCAGWQLFCTLSRLHLGYTPKHTVQKARETVGRVRWGTKTYQRQQLKAYYMGIKPPKSVVKDPEARSDAWKARQAAAVVEGPPDPNTRIYNLLRRPTLCRHFAAKALDARDGHEVANGKIVCDTPIVCPMCAMQRFGATFDLLTDPKSPFDWGEIREELDPAKRKRFYGFWIELPDPKLVEPFKRAVARRSKTPKVALLSANPQTGAIVLCYVADDSTLFDGLYGASLCVSDEAGVEVKIHTKEVQNGHKAAQWVFDAQLAPSLFTERLLAENRKDDLFAWLGWWKGRQTVVHRGKKGLPFPSREEVRASVRKDKLEGIEEYEGQTLRWQTIHADTAFVIHESDKRPTIDTAAYHATHNEAFHEFHAKYEQALGVPEEAPAPSGRTRSIVRPHVVPGAKTETIAIPRRLARLSTAAAGV